ncbi:MAG TPA: 4Fe-4S binding protein [Bacteroidales bacterium]|nr:4Fe-4S binding protein [Bacteroidales bacterium]HRZ77499.1 4Fe-4S binding protein [Bacteroidales bacterium]
MSAAAEHYDGDLCRCPSCGYSSPHRRGYPCFRELCPQCGTALQRQKGGADLRSLRRMHRPGGGARALEEHPRVVREDCISCGICLDACNFDAIHFREGKAWIDQARCTRCGECLCLCPRNAIRDSATGRGC